MSIPVIEQAKIQARVLVPLVKALQAELGEERANAIVRKALGDMYRTLGEKWWQAREASSLGDTKTSCRALITATSYTSASSMTMDQIRPECYLNSIQ